MSQAATVDSTAASSTVAAGTGATATTAPAAAAASIATASLFPPTIILGGQANNAATTATATATNSNDANKSCRLEGLTVNPMDGTLICSPLSAIVNAVTEGLYDELKEKSETLQSLSFAQRHFELSKCMGQHLKRVAHVTALTEYTSVNSNNSDHWKGILDSVQQTLRHVRVSWGAADEAQDALFFHHADLWKARSHCHDLYGAMQTLLQGQWTDLSRDLQLQQPPPTTEQTTNNQNKKTTKAQECLANVQSLVRAKLVQELSYSATNNTKNDNGSTNTMAWKKKATSWDLIRLEQKQIVVKCVFGPKDTQNKHAMEVRLTVLSNVWTLLELHVQVQAKTGESHHSCHVQNSQMFTLHKLCTKALQQHKQHQQQSSSSSLETLFQICHEFLQSWQFQLLYFQAYSLSKSKTNTLPTLTVIQNKNNNTNNTTINQITLYFWSPMEERFATLWQPSIGPLDSTLPSVDNGNNQKSATTTKNHDSELAVDASRYCLQLVGIPSKGIQVYLTGAAYLDANDHNKNNTNRNIKEVLQHIQNPQQVSVSHAILAATVICAQQKCHALVQYYNSSKYNDVPWMKVTADGGTIVISYQQQSTTVLFRVEVDSKTGNFIITFPKSYTVLYSLLPNNTIAANKAIKQQQRGLTKRFIKDAVDGLVRSMDVLSKRVGVGVHPNKEDEKEILLLRERAMDSACVDVRKSFMICSAIAYTYGIGAISLTIASSVQVVPDIAGDDIIMSSDKNDMNTTNGGDHEKNIAASLPPLSVIMNQEMVEQQRVNPSDGEIVTSMVLQRELFAITCFVNSNTLSLQCHDIETYMESPTQVPIRTSCIPLSLEEDNFMEDLLDDKDEEEPVSKRTKYDNNDNDSRPSIFSQVQVLAPKLQATLAKHYQE